MSAAPILYSFRRCPYAMRARMGLWSAGITVNLREVKLANKPSEMLEASPKGTVPVLKFGDGKVLEESEDIMRWALSQNDPEDWLSGDDAALIGRVDGQFKHHLDRYKYPNRYVDEPGFGEVDHRAEGLAILRELDQRLEHQAYLCGEKRTLADMATFPFIRQFANTDRAWFDGQDLPHLKPWLERLLSSDIFAAIMPKFTPWKADDAVILFGPETANSA